MLGLLCCSWRTAQRSCSILLLLSPALASAQRSERASAPASDTAAITAHEIAYFEFIAAAPLAAGERLQLTRDTAAAVQAEPARMSARGHNIATVLAHLPTWHPGQAEMTRAEGRLILVTVDPADIGCSKFDSTENDGYAGYDATTYDEQHVGHTKEQYGPFNARRATGASGATNRALGQPASPAKRRSVSANGVVASPGSCKNARIASTLRSASSASLSLPAWYSPTRTSSSTSS